MQQFPQDIADEGGQGIPPELQDLMDEMLAAKAAKIQDIGKDVARKRDEAVKARKQSGIELIWEQDEDYYQGVDEANRDSHPMTKSASTSGGLSRSPNKSTTRCSSFFNITAQFVDSASARLGDILLPAGDWNFAVKPSPVQDDDGSPSSVPGAVQGPDSLPQAQPLALPAPAAPAVGGPGTPVPAAQDPNAAIAPLPNPNAADPSQLDAERRAAKGELWIQDKLVECSYHTEVRKVIDDSARLGTGVLKGPFPAKKTLRKAMQRDGKFTLELVEQTNPASKHVDPRDFFPDPSCGDSIHNGSYVVERDRLTAKQLLDLKGVPGYLSAQIDEVLDEGPSKKNYSDGSRVQGESTCDDDTFEVWYFYGLIDVVSLSAAGNKLSESESTKMQIPAIVTLVNDTAIRATIDPLDSGEFPYDVMPWTYVAGTWTGKGVARQGRTPQDMLNAAGRAMMDNAGLSSGPMIIIRRGAIMPADGKWEITARKVWWATEQADQGRTMADAFTAVNIPMIQNELNAIMDRAEKMMEDATGISSLLLGQQGSSTDTVEGMKMLHQNASALLRRLARVFDERVTEPHIKRYYEWLLLHGPDDAKGDMNIEATGSTALVEREIQAADSLTLLQLSVNPIFGLDPAKAMVEVLKSKRFIADKWQRDPGTQPPAQTIPAIEVAKMRSADVQAQIAADKDKTIAANTLTKHKIDVEQNREDIYHEAEQQIIQTNAQERAAELQVKKQLALLDYANKRNISLDQVKAELAQTAMKLRTQSILSNNGTRPSPQVATPPVEVPGRAKDGFAFEQ